MFLEGCALSRRLPLAQERVMLAIDAAGILSTVVAACAIAVAGYLWRRANRPLRSTQCPSDEAKAVPDDCILVVQGLERRRSGWGRVAMERLPWMLGSWACLFTGVAFTFVGLVLLDFGPFRSVAPRQVLRSVALAELTFDKHPGTAFIELVHSSESEHFRQGSSDVIWLDSAMVAAVGTLAAQSILGDEAERFMLYALHAGVVDDELACRFLELRVNSLLVQGGLATSQREVDESVCSFWDASIAVPLITAARAQNFFLRTFTLGGMDFQDSPFGHLIIYDGFVVGPRGRARVLQSPSCVLDTMASRLLPNTKSLVLPPGGDDARGASAAGLSYEVLVGYSRTGTWPPEYFARLRAPAEDLVPTAARRRVFVPVSFARPVSLQEPDSPVWHEIMWGYAIRRN